jgi:signal transduction histidine kinase
LQLDDLPIPSPAMSIALMRLVQEALTNAVKHGKATVIEVTMKREGRNLVGSIRDNGVGFEPERTSAGLGLQTMQERIAAFGGSLKIQSAPQQGTTVEFTLPL